MINSTRKSKAIKVAAVAAALGSLAAIGFAGSSPAQADPKAFKALVAVGSDTTQDVTNAFAGFSSGINYTPLQSTAASGQTQIISFDAGSASCVATKTGLGAILRPNGSTAGRRILSQVAQGLTTWGTGSTCQAKDPSGTIDFARSSSGPALQGTPATQPDTGTVLTYVPFARDALTFAYYSADGTSGTDTTQVNLDTIFTNGTGLIGTTPVIPCGIQTSSGTYGSWNSMVGVTGDEMEFGTTLCRTLLGVPDATGRLQEHNGPQLKIKGDLLALQSNALCDGIVGGAVVPCTNTQVIIGFSASQFVARSNGQADPNPGPGVGLGSIAGQAFVTGTAPNVLANATGYANTAFGRDVYNVFISLVIDDTSNAVLQSLFVGPDSAVCSADTTVTSLGFIPLSNAACGTTTLRGSYFTGNS